MSLIDRSLAGDEAAFADLFHQYKNLVYKTALLMLDDPQEAEDALQEVFIRVHGSLASFDPARGAFTTWLYRLTVNHCLNRRRKKRPVVHSLDEDVPAGRLNGRQHSLEKQVEIDDAVHQALSGLSEKLRAVVVLRYFWNLPYAEIADILEVPVGTVKSRLNLALNTLRQKAGQSPQEEVAR